MPTIYLRARILCSKSDKIALTVRSLLQPQRAWYMDSCLVNYQIGMRFIKWKRKTGYTPLQVVWHWQKKHRESSALHYFLSFLTSPGYRFTWLRFCFWLRLYVCWRSSVLFLSLVCARARVCVCVYVCACVRACGTHFSPVETYPTATTQPVPLAAEALWPDPWSKRVEPEMTFDTGRSLKWPSTLVGHYNRTALLQHAQFFSFQIFLHVSSHLKLSKETHLFLGGWGWEFVFSLPHFHKNSSLNTQKTYQGF